MSINKVHVLGFGTALATMLALAAPAQARKSNDAPSYLPLGQEASAPRGFLDMCASAVETDLCSATPPRAAAEIATASVEGPFAGPVPAAGGAPLFVVSTVAAVGPAAMPLLAAPQAGVSAHIATPAPAAAIGPVIAFRPGGAVLGCGSSSGPQEGSPVSLRPAAFRVDAVAIALPVLRSDPFAGVRLADGTAALAPAACHGAPGTGMVGVVAESPLCSATLLPSFTPVRPVTTFPVDLRQPWPASVAADPDRPAGIGGAGADQQPSRHPSAAVAAASMSDAAAEALLRRVNRRVNTHVVQETDEEIYGTSELWRRSGIGRGARGDCEDLAIEKRLELVAEGFPPDRLALAVVFSHQSGLHTILVARTGRGDLVLDSLNPYITRWSDTQYAWLSVQSMADPMIWRSLDSTAAGAPSAATPRAA